MKSPLAPDERSLRAALQAGMAHHDAGRLAEAEAIYREVLAAFPDRPEALVLLGDIAHRTGRSAEALERLEHAVRVNPSAASYHQQLGMVLESCGRLAEAERAYRKALAANGGNPAYLDLGNVLLAQGRADEAVAAYRRAIAQRPAEVAARNNLGRALEAQGRLDEALGAYREALALGEPAELRANFARCAARGARLPADEPFRALLARALDEAWARPADLARPAIALIRADAQLRRPIEAALAAWPARLPATELFGASTLPALSRHALLLALLANAQVCDAGLEHFLTAARHALLELAAGTGDLASGRGDVAARPGELAEGVDFACALARQCFLNDYLFGLTAPEAERAAALAQEIEAAVAAGQTVPPARLAIAAAYAPLGTLACAPALLERDGPAVLHAVLVQQVEAPRLEREQLSGIARRTAIRDEVSLEVRRQYEESPYPRWVGCAPSEPLAFDAHVRELFPRAPLAGLPAQPEILVAGCGTGQESVEIARRFPASRVLAIDLSAASLAFAMRKSRELGVANLEYAQADIMEIGSLGRTFDFISCVGVLHHLRDPLAGWRALAALLAPGGFMQVGLYSEIARREIAAARDLIAARGYAADAEGIRRCREELLASPRFAGVTRLRDFYGLHECRDLLFHVEEHRYSLPQVGEMAASLDLEFLGLVVDPAMRRRCATRLHGGEPDLAAWDAFERDFPEAFAGMYLFWVRKPGGT